MYKFWKQFKDEGIRYERTRLRIHNHNAGRSISGWVTTIIWRSIDENKYSRSFQNVLFSKFNQLVT